MHREVSLSASDLPEFSWSRAIGAWEVNPVLLSVCCLALTGYLLGVRALHRRGDHWAFSRSVSFAMGVWSFIVATSSGLATYDTTLLSVHMVQHMVLSMLVPLLVALGAPVTLALRTLPRSSTASTLLRRVLHSRLSRVLTFAPLTLALYVVSPWALYFTGWYEATLRSSALHELLHVHLVLVGSLFFWPLLGVDPVPGRIAYPFRLLLILLTLPFHAFLGVTIMGQATQTGATLIAGDWYVAVRDGPMASWLPPVAADQRLAGGILWASGDLIGALLFAVLFAQWLHESRREAIREDRRLDRLDARANRARLASRAAERAP
ncbi:MAG: cytochrome c oxidase assembly protein [Nocardioides sp.]